MIKKKQSYCRFQKWTPSINGVMVLFLVFNLWLIFKFVPKIEHREKKVNMFTSFQDNYCENAQSRHVVYTLISLKICFILSLGQI